MIPLARNKKAQALIVEGGGMRGSFAGGAIAAMTCSYPSSNYDLVVGVSAGSCDATYYVVSGKNDLALAMSYLNIWRQELVGSRLINFLNPLRGKRFLNQEFLIDKIFAKKYRLKRELIDEARTQLYIVVSNLKTLLPEYVKATSSNILQLLKAATSIPIATAGRRNLFGNAYTDGGVLDPLPVEAVLKAGYRRLTVILNGPLHAPAEQISRWLSYLSYPFNKKIRRRLHTEYHTRYNRALEILKNPPEGIEVRVIAPEAKVPAGLVTTSEKKVNRNIDLGLKAGFQNFAEHGRKAWLWKK